VARPSVRLHPDAIAEAKAAYEWYAERNPSAANAFISELDHAINQIQSSPERWSMHVRDTRKFLLRRFP
jgi:toxin ParE1/3/4